MSKRTDQGPADRALRELVEKLRAVQRACADRAPEERGKTLRATLAEELGRTPPDLAAGRLEELRDYLGGRDADATRRLDSLTEALRQLRGEVEALRRERDRLLREQTSLEPSPAPAAGREGALEGFRQGLLRITEDRKVTPEEAGVPPHLAPLFQTMAELLHFALDLEIGLQGFLRTSEVGEVGMMGTRQFAEHERMIRNRFRSCLQDQEAAIQPLKEVLGKNLRFLIHLHQAYSTCIDAGTRSLLAPLDPQKILEESRGRLGVNYPEAWKRISRLLAELAALEKGEMWERYFEEPFRNQLKLAVPEAGPEDPS